MSGDTTDILTNFTAGELSPKIEGRIDINRYRNGCRWLENFSVNVQGGVTRSPGTQFIYAAKSEAIDHPSRLVSFVFSTTQAYVLEFANLRIRVFKDGQIVMDGASPLEIVSPYGTADLPHLQFSQSADVLWIWGGACPAPKPPRKLSRTSHVDWTLDLCVFPDGPYLEENIDPDSYISPSAALGNSITLTASKPIFTAAHVGSRWRLIHPGNTVRRNFSSTSGRGRGSSAQVSAKLKTYGAFYLDLTPHHANGWSGKITLQRSIDAGKTWGDAAVITGSSSRSFYESDLDVLHRLIMKSGDYHDGSCQCKLYTLSQIGIVEIVGFTSDRVVTAWVHAKIGQAADPKTQSGSRSFMAATQFLDCNCESFTNWTDADSGTGESTLATYDPNMVLNGGGETAGGGGADVFANWTETTVNGATVVRTTTAGEFRTGSAAIKLVDGTIPATDYAQVSQSFTVLPATDYVLNFFDRSAGVVSGQYAIYDNTNAAYIRTARHTFNATTGWVQCFDQFTTPGGCVSISLRLISPMAGTNAFACFDDVRLMPLDDSELRGCFKFMTGAHGVTALAKRSYVAVVPQYLVPTASFSMDCMFSQIGTYANTDIASICFALHTLQFEVIFTSTTVKIGQDGSYYDLDISAVPVTLNKWRNYTFMVAINWTSPKLSTCSIYVDGVFMLSGVPCGTTLAYVLPDPVVGSQFLVDISLRGNITDNLLCYVDQINVGQSMAHETTLLDVDDEPEAARTVNAAAGVNLRTNKWSEGAWSDQNGYPACGGFFQQRLMAAGTAKQPQTVWGSANNKYNDFSPSTQLDGSLNFSLNSDQVNPIVWVVSKNQLILGTKSGPWTLGPETASEALSPINVKGNEANSLGVAAIAPLRTGQTILYVERGGRKVRELVYSFDVDNYVAPDLSIISEHLPGTGITSGAFASHPNQTGYFRLEDGRLCCLTYERHQEVVAWAQRTTKGSFESFAVIPNAQDGSDEVWVSAFRYINHNSKRFIERLSDPLAWDRVAGDDYYHVDCGITYSGPHVSSIGGLDHLIGETVRVFADGKPCDDAVVSGSGQIDFKVDGVSVSRSKAQVGLGFDSKLAPMRLTVPQLGGSGQGKRKRLVEIFLRVTESMRGKICSPMASYPWGPDMTRASRIVYRNSAGVPLFTDELNYGDIGVLPMVSWDQDGYFWLVCDTAAPFSLDAIIYSLEVGE